MTRVLMLGLAWLALMVAPFSEAVAQVETPESASEQAAQSADPAPSAPVPEELPAAESSPTEGLPREPESVLVVPGRDASGTSLVVRDDLAPGAMIVTDGEPLDIGEAVALAIRNGLNVQVERYGPLIASAEADAAWGAYDPLLYADARWDVVKSPNTFPLSRATTNRDRTVGGGVGLSQLIPYLGASISARFDSTGKVTRSTFEPFDERYDSSFFLNARVPLLRNLVWNSEWTSVQTAALGNEVAEQDFRRALMDNVQSTVNRYWALVAARDRVRVAQKSLETARALLDQTRTQYEVGVVSQVEVVEAEAGVANREFELIQSANTFRNEQDLLLEAVYGTRLAAATELQIVPTAELKAHSLAPLDVQRAVASAFDNRPELRVAQKAIEQNEINLRFAKSQRLPQLDLDAQYGYVGVSGDGNDSFRFQFTDELGNVVVVPPPTDRNYGESADDFFTGAGADNVRVQGTFSIPIPNTAGRKRVIRNEFDLRRSKSSRIRLEQNIILEVRSATRTLLAASQGIEAAERRRLAAEEQLRAERIRLEHGESTPFEVLQREEDLVEAESQKINALQLFHAAETALERAQGTILEAHAIELEAARKPVR